MTNEQLREAREQMTTLQTHAGRHVWAIRACFGVILAMAVWALAREGSPSFLVAFHWLMVGVFGARLATIERMYYVLRREFADLDALIKKAGRDPV